MLFDATCLKAIENDSEGDKSGRDPLAKECIATGTPFYHPNEWARLLAAHLRAAGFS